MSDTPDSTQLPSAEDVPAETPPERTESPQMHSAPDTTSEPSGTENAQQKSAEKPKRKRRRKVGRPTGLHHELGLKICRRIKNGMSLTGAAKSLGLNPGTVKSWYARGCDESASRLFKTFTNNVQRARELGIYSNALLIKQAAEGGAVTREKTWTDTKGNECTDRSFAAPDWRAAAHLNAITDPERWSQKRRVEHSGTVRHEKISLNLSAELTDEEKCQIAQLLRKALPDKQGALPDMTENAPEA